MPHEKRFRSSWRSKLRNNPRNPKEARRWSHPETASVSIFGSNISTLNAHATACHTTTRVAAALRIGVLRRWIRKNNVESPLWAAKAKAEKTIPATSRTIRNEPEKREHAGERAGENQAARTRTTIQTTESAEPVLLHTAQSPHSAGSVRNASLPGSPYVVV